MLVNSYSELKDILIRSKDLNYPITVKIEQYKPLQSKSQRGLFQAITRRMADYTGYTHGEMKLNMQRTYLGVEEIDFKWKGQWRRKERVISTTSLAREDYTKFLNAVLQVAADLDIFPEGDEE